MSQLHVGFVDYINAYPANAAFREGIVQTEAKITYDTPNNLNEMLKKGELDIALTSAIVYLEDKNTFDFLPHLGIGTNGAAKSVNLYHKGELASLNGKTIKVTHESAISIALLQTLCEKYWKIQPQFEKATSLAECKGADAMLLIGDEALKQQHIEGYTTLDLGAVWNETTKLGFAFALYVVRKEALNNKKIAIELFTQDLEKSISWGEDNRPEVIKMAEKKSGLSSAVITDYYNHLLYRLTKEEMRGLSVFDYLRISNFHVPQKRP